MRFGFLGVVVVVVVIGAVLFHHNNGIFFSLNIVGKKTNYC